MYIKLVEPYSTDIKDILQFIDDESIFISSWDKSDNILNFDNRIIQDSINNRSHENTYIMSKDMHELKEKVKTIFIQKGTKIKEENLTIVSNGTSAAFITFLQYFKKNISNFLCIGPIYFTYTQLLKIFQKNLFYYQINLFDNLAIDYKVLEQELLDNNIQSILIIQPLFGSGVSIPLDDIYRLIYLCTKNKIHLVIDYIYGNMEWNNTEYIHNCELVKHIVSSEYCILYESVSKRIFLNGIKSAIIYGNHDIIRNINTDSEICLGSIAYVQESLLNNIYTKSNLSILNSQISDTLKYAYNNYQLIKTMIADTDFLLSDTDSGYFSLIAIPIQYFENTAEKDIVYEIYTKCGIITIPHSRYCYYHLNYYCFRVNLTLDTNEILTGIQRLLNLCFN